MVDKRLCLFEPIASSTKQLRLVIGSSDLQQQIFISFHVNPLGGHLGLYYTLLKIRLRFHWPHMYKYIEYKISSCAACVLRSHNSRPASELLYSFPIDAPFLSIHADAWVPGKTNSFDRYQLLMIVVLIEPLKEMNSTSFTKAANAIQLRYGLSHLMIIDTDSKFKGEFVKAAELLKIKLHPVTRGNHDAIMVERFNRFLNSSLLVFNNNRKSNRVFLEGAMMCTYAWNSAPVAGTDLSWALLVLGRENSLSNRLYNERTSDISNIRLRDTILRVRHAGPVGKMSTDLHAVNSRATYLSPRTSQCSVAPSLKVQARRPSLRSCSSAKQAIQRKSSKLAYRTQGPYKIAKLYPSGSYDLQSLKSPSLVSIKKHAADLYPCPQYIKPFLHASISVIMSV
jgi:hypothetical protein